MELIRFLSQMKLSEQIGPALKSWLDNVIVPALVKEYLTELHLKNEIASPSKLGIESPIKTDPSSEEYS
jgi:hypothetical protein